MPLALLLLCALHDSVAVERRVDSVLAQMSIEQKVALIGGVDDMFTRASRRTPIIVGTTGLRLHQEIFDNETFSGTPIDTSTVDGLPPDGMTPLPRNARGVRWTGTYTPKTTGQYMVIARAYDGYRVTFNDSLAIEQKPAEGASMKWAVGRFVAGQPERVELTLVPRSQSPRVILGIRAVDSLISPEAVQIAKAADVAVVSVGFDPSNESEGSDRTFSLPWGQEQLINAIVAANPRTVVTLTAGGAVATQNWLSHMPALLHTWYPGQEGGTAVADVLFGVTNPEGHLPISFERRWEDNPTHDSYYATNGHVTYSEGVFLGYRYYTGSSTKPLFPFGFGLTYTTFSFSHLTVSPQHIVSFDVTNTGARTGADVAQVYVGDPSARIKRPTKELKAFEKVRLAPGETKHVALQLNERAFSYWDHGWRIDPGQFVIYVGDSSEHTPLSVTLDVAAKGSAVHEPSRR